MTTLFSWSKGILFGGSSNKEVDYESLSYEDLLKKASEIEFDNNKMNQKISEIQKENNILKNSIIKKNDNHSEYSKFLNLMEKNLLNITKNNMPNDYSIDKFKNFLYNEHIMLGTLEEDQVNYLMNSNVGNNLNWNDKKEEYLLKQNIFEKNLKELYSNMIISKINKSYRNNKNKNIKKEEDKKENNNKEKEKENDKKEEKIINNDNNSNKNLNIFLNEKINMNPINEYIGKKKENEVNVLEDMLLKDKNDSDDE